MSRLLAFVATDAFVRRRAVEDLAPAELADAAVAYGLRRLLAADRDVAVRALAAGALGSIRTRPSSEPTAPVPDPIPWLVDALVDESPVVRDAAIRALARHAAPAAYARLCTLARTDTTWWVRRAALYALGVMGASSSSSGASPSGASSSGASSSGASSSGASSSGASSSGASSSGATSMDPIAPARAALSDPFWRVRHAAIQVLATYGARAPERRVEILADIEGGTAQYLSALWGPTLLEGSPREPIASRLPPELLDRDPAVVTARLADMDSPPLSIVELLCDPHVPLRTLAAARLIEANDPTAFADALRWLDEPRIPHVAATVTTMLDSLGDAARDLATQVLSAPARPGASRWAIGWVVATRYMDLAQLAWARAVAMNERVLAMPLAPITGLVETLRTRTDDEIEGVEREAASDTHDPITGRVEAARSDDQLALAAADELLLRPARVRREALAAITPHSSSMVRMRLAAAAGLELGPSASAPEISRGDNSVEIDDAVIERGVLSHIDAALRDRDPLSRATALSILGSRVSADARRAALADRDPAVRESLVANATSDELCALLETERDPWVRRTAGRALVRVIRDATRNSARSNLRGGLVSDEMVGDADGGRTHGARAALVRLSADADEWIRTLTVPFLDPARSDELARIVALAADSSLMVQSAIVEKLATISDEDLQRALATTVPATAGEQRSSNATGTTRAIDAWLAAGAEVPHIDARRIDAPPVDAPPVDAPRNDATRALHVDVRPIDATRNDGGRALQLDPTDGAQVSRRAFGSSGVLTTPLVISGAFDLQPGSLRVAAERGVTTYFWEPAYSGLTRFLRSKSERARSQVVTGTYHADARSIEKDVDRALRRLRRDVIDIYLLFWARSDARLDEQAFAVMDGLKRAGKVRAVGFSTHDRELAMGALDLSPWDVVMTRHSAAHAGIENGMLAHAKAKGAGVLTFTALCYGRMLKGDGAPSARDCYRYSLAQDGVTATISAPRRHRELVENLEVLSGAMTDEEIARVKAHGARVRVESQKFNALVRQPTRDAAAAAMAMLEEALAPGEGDRDEACVTAEALQRSLGSRGRGRASLPSAMLRRGRL